MSTRLKFLITYIGGIITGAILVFVFAFLISPKSNLSSSSNDIVMFDTPQQEIKIQSFKVMQVLPDGNALAMAEDVEDMSYYGTVVLFLADGDKSFYYDNQIIEIPSGKCVMQVGAYRYENQLKMTITVPVVEIIDLKDK